MVRIRDFPPKQIHSRLPKPCENFRAGIGTSNEAQTKQSRGQQWLAATVSSQKSSAIQCDDTGESCPSSKSFAAALERNMSAGKSSKRLQKERRI